MLGYSLPMGENNRPSTTNDATGLQGIISQLVRFNLVGVLNTLVDFCVFFLLNQAGVGYLAAQICSYGCGTINSYLFNKYWTFGKTGTTLAEIARFLAVNLSALLLSVLLLHLLHTRAGIGLAPAKIAATLLTMLVGFFGTRFWVFPVGNRVAVREER